MIGQTVSADVATNVSPPVGQAPHEDGWYLYGVTRLSQEKGTSLWDGDADPGVAAACADLGAELERVELLEVGSLAAVVRRVPLADFTADALRDRLGDPTGLAAIVQHHNAVIQAVHRRQAILPAKLGAVYSHVEDIAAAVEQGHEALMAQLGRLDGCDEWAVHVYIDQRAMQAHAIAEQAPDWDQQLAAASPGRAYLLRRKLADAIAAKTAEVTEEITLDAYQRLARLAVDGQGERPASPPGDADGETEVLRAAFLVDRERSEEFLATVHACGEDGRGWRCTCSGPWPPYSFAATPVGDGHDRQDA